MRKSVNIKEICNFLRYDILTSTTKAGSGHPTSSFSAVELMATLLFGGFFHQDLKNPKDFWNDRLIFSKGHASPLLYGLYHAADALTYKEILSLRRFGSPLEGHPVPRFSYADVSTGSLGQGLSVGVGMALGIKLRIKNLKLKIKREPKVWVLIGDSEMAEGQVWEALEIASYYKLNNLIGIIDINRLGQRGETMLGWDIRTYEKRINSFGWKTIIIKDGHNLDQVYESYKQTALSHNSSPTMLIAKTIKGKGTSFLENKDDWHGKPLNKQELKLALRELGKIDFKIRGKIEKPNLKLKISNDKSITNHKIKITKYKLGNLVATREAYGDALVRLGKKNSNIVVLDAEVSNSTYANKFKKQFPDRFFEMFIAEQNMVSAALGLSKQGFIPYVSSFAAFLTRSFDQIRIAQYSLPNLKIIGSHVGVSIGADGPSQMGLEDLAMMQSILKSIVFYPADAISTLKIMEIMEQTTTLSYLRTTREKTPLLYSDKETFKIGGSKIHKTKGNDKNLKVTIVAAGITLHEALKAQKQLEQENIKSVVIDCYSVKPIDSKTINKYVNITKNILVVEDHYPSGGLGDAIMKSLNTFSINYKFVHLAVTKIPSSGSIKELLEYEKIDSNAILSTVKQLV